MFDWLTGGDPDVAAVVAARERRALVVDHAHDEHVEDAEREHRGAVVDHGLGALALARVVGVDRDLDRLLAGVAIQHVLEGLADTNADHAIATASWVDAGACPQPGVGPYRGRPPWPSPWPRVAQLCSQHLSAGLEPGSPQSQEHVPRNLWVVAGLAALPAALERRIVGLPDRTSGGTQVASWCIYDGSPFGQIIYCHTAI